MKLGDDVPKKYDLSKLRLLGSVGEPINPEAWMWYQKVIGGERCPIVDTWWQTETGAILISPVPGATATKPGSCTLPLPGIDVDIVDDNGKQVLGVNAGGYLVIKKPWPSMLRTLWRDNDRYISAYWKMFKQGYYVAGDSAHRDKDGYYWIMGRIDDVLNVAGHRLGTMEVESALVAHPRVAEAAVVGKPHEIKGESVFAFVVCRGQRPTGDTSAFVKELRDWVTEQLGAIARPDDIRFADNLPKTRSGKIMRRLLKTVARGEEITQDVSTLENPAILDQLRGADPAVAPVAAASGGGKKSAGKTGAKSGEKSAPQAAKKGGEKSAARKAVGKAAKKATTASAKKSSKKPVKRAAKKSVKAAANKAATKGSPKSASGKAATPKAAGRKPGGKTNTRRASASKRTGATAGGQTSRAKSKAKSTKKSAVKRPLHRRGG
jgi:hypothetical protein